MAHHFPLIFGMKLESHKSRHVTEPKFLKKSPDGSEEVEKSQKLLKNVF